MPSLRFVHAILVGDRCGRMASLLMVLALSSCMRPGHTEQQAGTADPVIAALEHFRTSSEVWLSGDSDDRPVILVSSRYTTNTGFISKDQLDGEFMDESWTIPEDARLEINRRTRSAEPLSITDPPPWARLIDLEAEVPVDDITFNERYPDARCLIELWPTGFTSDGQRAVVRFFFDPTPHGATATYLLERRDGRWYVVHHALTYYV